MEAVPASIEYVDPFLTVFTRGFRSERVCGIELNSVLVLIGQRALALVVNVFLKDFTVSSVTFNI